MPPNHAAPAPLDVTDVLVPAQSPVPDNSATPAGELHILPLSEIAAESVRWLWPGYLPLAKLVVLEGHPGLGKSAVTLDLAARLSVGLPMPDGASAGGPADTLVFSYEDSAADTLRPRVEAAGGDASRVHHVLGVGSKGDDGIIPATLPTDVNALKRALAKRPNVRLIVIDPLVAAFGDGADINREQDVRRVLGRLSKIAVAHDVTVLAVRHLRKALGGPATSAGSGATGIGGLARASLLVAQDPDDADASVLASVKSNLGPAPASLGFHMSTTILGEGTSNEVRALRLEWTGDRGLTKDDLSRSAPRHEGRGNREADRWLQATLGNGPQERAALFLAAQAEGLGPRRVQRAAARLQVVQTREGQGDQHRSLWTLPVNSAGGPVTRSTNSTRSTIANVERVELVERVEPATEAGTEPTAIGTMAEARRSVISTGTAAA